MDNILDLTGKTALVTGASGGLGRSFAVTLARYGARVAVSARRADHLAETVALIEKTGGAGLAVEIDVTDPEAVKAGFAGAEAELGPVDIVVANAGVGPRGTTLDMTATDWTSVIDANLNGVFFTAQEATRRMIASGTRGSIINTASIMALRVRPGAPAYAASKAAVAHLTQALALEFAEHGIRVNALAPGYFETDLNRKLLHSEKGRALVEGIPMKRTGEFHELDGALLLLASQAGSFMTGTVITVDGGHVVKSL